MKSKGVFLAMFDVILLAVASIEVIDQWLRVIAGVGGIIVLILTTIKLLAEIEANREKKRGLKLDNQIKEQELGRQLILNKNKDDSK